MKLVFCLPLLIFLSSSLFAQEPVAIDFTHLKADLEIDPEKGVVQGEIEFTFDILLATDTIAVDAQNMDFSEVLLNDGAIAYQNNSNQLYLTGSFSPAREQKLRMKYAAQPRQTMYFIRQTAPSSSPSYQVWTQGQGKNTSNWLPSFDDPTEKLEFDLSIQYPSNEVVIANGELQADTMVNDSIKRWEFDMQKPMSSYLVAVAAGNYDKEVRFSKSGVPILLYFPSGMKEVIEPTYRYTEFMMDFFEQETNVAYPWKNYKQVPVQDFLYAGMENTGTTIFSDLFLVDSIGFNDRNYVNVNAHELAHQWFGNLVTAAGPEDHWLQEGLSTYYALLAEKEIFGDDYYYRQLFKSAEELKQLSDQGKGSPVVSGSGTSLTYYQKGAWALHILNERIGKEAFREGIENYLKKYQYATATTEDFISEMETAAGMDLSNFVKDWLLQSAFQGTMALESLKKSPFIQKYLELAAAKPFAISDKKKLLLEVLEFPVNDYLGQEAVFQLALEDSVEVQDLYMKAFSSGNLYTRQAIAFSLQEIPVALKSNYESLLNDDSYLTLEAALYNLWMNFPGDRTKYLKQLEGVNGSIDKNLRTLWLALSIATPEVSAALKKVYLSELIEYTAPYQKFQIRQNAFRYLYQLNVSDQQVISNLIEASNHHNYRFREFSKQLIQTLVENGQLLPEELERLQQKYKASKGD